MGGCNNKKDFGDLWGLDTVRMRWWVWQGKGTLETLAIDRLGAWGPLSLPTYPPYRYLPASVPLCPLVGTLVTLSSVATEPITGTHVTNLSVLSHASWYPCTP